MALPRPKPQKAVVGREKPRLAPPTPARSALDRLVEACGWIKVSLLPWQKIAGRYVYALARDEQWLYPEVALIVSRQSGKTTLLKPHVMARLEMGRSILHAAQKRDLVRKMFQRDLVPAARVRWPDAVIRLSGGQESIFIPSTGGSYEISAATGGGPRGQSVDDLIMDELRELDEDFVEAAKATQAASLNPQTVYLSNAGHDGSLALNELRQRADEDPALAWLEWSAAPERQVDDIEGWMEANPSLGHFPGQLAFLQRTYNSHRLAGTLSHFETEHLCRWVSTMRERLVDPFAWSQLSDPELPLPSRQAVMAVSMSPDGSRASAAVAWLLNDASYGLRLLFNVTGNPIDTGRLGDDVKKEADRLGIRRVAFDPLTDGELAKYFKKPEPLSGQKFANASAQFVNIISSGRLHWADADPVTDDLTWTSRKHDAETGSFQAVRAQDDRAITASLAAIRAVYLASGPKPAIARML